MSGSSFSIGNFIESTNYEVVFHSRRCVANALGPMRWAQGMHVNGTILAFRCSLPDRDYLVGMMPYYHKYDSLQKTGCQHENVRKWKKFCVLGENKITGHPMIAAGFNGSSTAQCKFMTGSLYMTTSCSPGCLTTGIISRNDRDHYVMALAPADVFVSPRTTRKRYHREVVNPTEDRMF